MSCRKPGKRYWTRHVVSCQPLAGRAARGKTLILRPEVVVRGAEVSHHAGAHVRSALGEAMFLRACIER
jgi:hypothetical protein